MSEPSGERLYNLLPGVYRVRDVEQGEPLRALLGVIETELESLEADMEGLYDDWFIETCSDWVVPYIGDLLSVRGLPPLEGGALGQRALVANTLGYRRRKGTAAMLEQLARDITGWPARAVEFFELLATTQHLNHTRPGKGGTVDIRDAARLDLLDSPFDPVPHVAEVRHVENGRGRYNAPNVGLFLWRLRSFAIENGDPHQVADPADGRYSFDPLGHEAPLYTRPRTETDVTQLAGEINIPGPIRPAAYSADLENYRSATPGERHSESIYYGPNRSLHIVKDGTTVPPVDVISSDLHDWERPPATTTGVLSGALSPFSGLTSEAPAVNVAVGGADPKTATLASPPATLAEAASLLQEAVREADPESPAFSLARAIPLDDRLLLLPGVRGTNVTFSPAPEDPTTLGELALDDASVQGTYGVLSGALSPFSGLTSEAPAVNVAVGGADPKTATLASPPATLAEAASLLQEAVREADPESPAFSLARAIPLDDRLLLLPGVPKEPIVLGPADATTIHELGMANKVAVDVGRGRFAFAVGDGPREDVKVSYSHGLAGDIGGGPYDRRRGEPDQTSPDTVAGPGTLGELLTVPTAFANIGGALSEWARLDKPPAVVQIEDNRTYHEDPKIDLSGSELVIQAANGRRPVLDGNVTLTDTVGEGRMTLDGLLISGGLHARRDEERSANPEKLSIRHCTLVPGTPSVVVDATNEGLGIEIDHSIVGPLRIPDETGWLDVRDSVIDSPSSGGLATSVPALISRNLSSLRLRSRAPAVNVTIGDEGPYRAVLPTGLARLNTTFRVMEPLQAAIRGANDSPAFEGARVIKVPNVDRLIVVPGVAAAVTIENADDDPTASELGLDPASSRHVYALVSGPLSSYTGLSSGSPSLNVTIGDDGPRTISLAGNTSQVASARLSLQDAIQAAPAASEAFTSALVGNLDDRLVVLPGVAEAAVTFAPSDLTTLGELALGSARPALAAGEGGERPGPPARLRRTTIFGAVHVRELPLASEVVFTSPVTVDRRQDGCVRFSYLPESSRTPPHFRCQPDLALQAAISSQDPSATRAQRDRVMGNILSRLRPNFVSTRYGEPGYAQLGATCAGEIRGGAEDEDEMGVFNSSQHERRIRNLRASLDEYLRFGLEAGILPVN